MTTTLTAPVVVPAEATAVVESVHPVRVLLATEGISLFEAVVRPGQEPPMHIHEREDEGFHVLEGLLAVHVDGVTHLLGPGGTALLPRGVPHTFAVRSDEVRMIVTCTPGGFEGMFAELPAPLDPATAGPVFAAYGITVTGPNPG